MDHCFFCGRLPDAPLPERELESLPVQSVGQSIEWHVCARPAWRAQVECMHVAGLGTHQVQGQMRVGRTAEEAVELAVQSWSEEQRERRARRLGYLAAEKMRLQGEVDHMSEDLGFFPWLHQRAARLRSGIEARRSTLRRLEAEEAELGAQARRRAALDPSGQEIAP